MPLRDVVSTRRSPGLRPQWCPVHSPYRRPDCCLPVIALAQARRAGFPTHCTASAFTSNNLRLILMTTTIHPPAIACHFMCCMDLLYWQWQAGISGLNKGPASLLPPASDSRYRVCLPIPLLTPPASQARALRAGCWPDFSQVGLSRTRFRITHWVTITHFIPL